MLAYHAPPVERSEGSEHDQDKQETDRYQHT